jgi:hypothetical protein
MRIRPIIKWLKLNSIYIIIVIIIIYIVSHNNYYESFQKYQEDIEFIVTRCVKISSIKFRI